MNAFKFSSTATTPSCKRTVTTIALAIFLAACGAAEKSPPTPEPGSAPRSGQTTSAFQSDLRLCKMKVNKPPPNDNRLIKRQTVLACAKGVELLVAPAPQACLTSGFGQRGGRLHKGIDYQSKPAGAVVSAGAGTVITKAWREKDFGNWIVIDHGQGVYTAYGHLASIASGINKGLRVRQGTHLGVMGATGNATSRIHLHVEYRVGDIKNPRGYWGLTPVNPFKLPERC